MLSQTYEVELPDANTIVSTELECDIQPGALRQRYSVQWKVQYNDTFMIINKNSFNLSLSIDSSLNGSQYRCEVTIDHDGERVNRTYEGRTIIIITTGIHCRILIMYESYTFHVFLSLRGDFEIIPHCNRFC